MSTAPAWKQLARTFVLLLAVSISVSWGLSLERNVHGGVMGFPGIYYGTRCLMQHCDPYNATALQQFYAHQDASSNTDSEARRQSLTLYVNLPTTFLFVAPFAILPLATAQSLWIILTVGCFCVATFLMGRLGSNDAPNVSVLLAFVMLSNCEIIFSGGNTAGLVVSLCVIAVWCFLEQRLVGVGVLCLAVSLAIKPHDAGLIWLYFLIAGRSTRRRAVQSGALAMALALGACLWVSLAAPHWMAELRNNLAAISAPGGINEPGPSSIGVSSPDMIIDLQTVISVFRNDPRIYNPVAYAICGLLLLAWLIVISRSPFDRRTALFALVSAASLSMLVTYHRSYDAKLLLLAIPACAMLRARRGAISWIGMMVTSLAVLLTGDIALTAFAHLSHNMQPLSSGFAGKVGFVLIGRPVPIVLFAVTVFYLWAYARSNSTKATTIGETQFPTPNLMSS
jgi:Glycosyltransferase family 87